MFVKTIVKISHFTAVGTEDRGHGGGERGSSKPYFPGPLGVEPRDSRQGPLPQPTVPWGRSGPSSLCTVWG